MKKNILIKFDDGTEEIVKLGVTSDKVAKEIIEGIYNRMNLVKYLSLRVETGDLVTENIVLNSDKIKSIKIVEEEEK